MSPAKWRLGRIKREKSCFGRASPSSFLLASPRRSFFFSLLLLFFLSPRFRTSSASPSSECSFKIQSSKHLFRKIYILVIAVFFNLSSLISPSSPDISLILFPLYLLKFPPPRSSFPFSFSFTLLIHFISLFHLISLDPVE